MTIERLREHLFGGRQVAFWNYDERQLSFGLELEYFIASDHAGTWKFATKAKFLEVLEFLKLNHGFNDSLPDSPGRASKDVEQGFIAVKPDFAWHVLEIALPPVRSSSELRILLTKTLAEVDEALAAASLTRLDASCLPEVPTNIEFVALDRLRGYLDSPVSDDPNSLASCRVFPALLAATHVHINCCNEESLRLLPHLYELEDEAMLRFSRAHVFQEKYYKNVRTEFYESALGPDYTLRTIPKQIPYDLESYAAQLNACRKSFPHDKFFPARDMSYIRPTTFGTFEFRSACSFRDVDTILEIMEFRKAQVLYARNRATNASQRSERLR